jgi:hypothetical protein
MEDLTELAETLREKVPDVTDREVQLFAYVWRTWPYVPENLIDMESGTTVQSVMNTWLEKTYGLKFRYPEDEKRRAKMPTKKKETARVGN